LQFDSTKPPGNTGASLDGQHYDAVVIGAGMSGLAASIRLGMYGHRTLLLERHLAPGGLNSFYRMGGHDFDVGLHALTNYVPPGVKGTPLGKIFRQLRMDRESLDLCPQIRSAIVFPGSRLQFSNDFELFRSEIAQNFPDEIEAFDRFTEFVKNYHAVNLAPDSSSARTEIQRFLRNPLLIEMLLCPLFYYGSARENDMDFGQLVVLFRALFLEGFCRPFEGVRPIIRNLLKRAKEVGVERKMGMGVRCMEPQDHRITSLTLDDGSRITARHVVSTIGSNETAALIQDTAPIAAGIVKTGRLSFAELIAITDQPPKTLGFEDTIVFFNHKNILAYERPDTRIDERSGVICVPNHYDYGDRELKNHSIRITAQANYPLWKALSKDDYAQAKLEAAEQLLATAVRAAPKSNLSDLKSSIVFRDLFTPTTITRYTGHLEGAVYGAPVKVKDGGTLYQNLYLCGTDQGFLGIVGAMLSGISIVNYHILKGENA
jgi:phytoene dehydrogenase-like protein